MNDLVVVEKIAGWEKLKALVLDSVSSPITKRVYNMALDECHESVPLVLDLFLLPGHLFIAVIQAGGRPRLLPLRDEDGYKMVESDEYVPYTWVARLCRRRIPFMPSRFAKA
jgi:hypothetical protein